MPGRLCFLPHLLALQGFVKHVSTVRRRQHTVTALTNFLPENENYTISVCFLHGFRTGDKVPGLNFVGAGIRITTGTPVILVQFIHCFTQLQAKIWRLYFESDHGPCVPHQLFTVIPC